MAQVTGYILILDNNRAYSFHTRSTEYFAEPVQDFNHSRNIPLVCFIIEDSQITYVGLASKGFRAGTDLRRLNVSNILELTKPLSVKEIASKTSKKVQHHLLKKVDEGGLLAPKSFNEFLDVFLNNAPESTSLLAKYSQERLLKIEKLSEAAKRNLAEQKEAIFTALNLAGIDKREILDWDFDEAPQNFMSCLTKVVVRESDVINHDILNFASLNGVKSKYSVTSIESDTSHLEIIYADSRPLEELLGTDLIYYNQDYKCFVMVQYKMMKKEGEKYVFRLTNEQLDKEIKRMDSFTTQLERHESNSNIDDYRISNSPFFLKFLKNIQFNPDDASLSKGKYVPLDYFKLFINSTLTD